MSHLKNIDHRGPIRVTPFIQTYSWGLPASVALSSRYSAEERTKSEPCAEAWFGAHPRGATTVSATTPPVSLLKYREALTPKNAELPFLLKILSIAKPLSIQLHPDAAQAQVLHRQNPINYPDPIAKPEVGIALTPATLLSGTRPLRELQELMIEHKELADCLASVGDSSNQPFLGAELIRAIYRAPQNVFSALSLNIIRKISNKIRRSEHEELVLSCAANYPSPDRGAIVALLMNYLTLAPGDAIFTPPGTLHAYVSGEFFECMRNSDNVVRGGLTEKFQDQETLCNLIKEHTPKVIPTNSSTGRIFEKEFPELSLNIVGTDGEICKSLSAEGILITTGGEVEIRCKSNSKITKAASYSGFYLPPGEEFSCRSLPPTEPSFLVFCY